MTKQPKYDLSVLEASEIEEANALSNVMLSVVRDMTISGYYGYLYAEKYNNLKAPLFSDIFTSGLCGALEERLKDLDSVDNVEIDLYGTHGDLLGWLSRLLLYCRENEHLAKHIIAADQLIEELAISAWFHDGKKEYLRHLRNAIAHSRFTVRVNEKDWEKSEIVFIDVKPSFKGKGDTMTAEIITTSSQLISILKIIIAEVYDKRLMEIDWRIGRL